MVSRSRLVQREKRPTSVSSSASSRFVPATFSASRARPAGRAPAAEHVAGAKRELAELLTEVGLFSRCTKRERETIARHAQTAELPSGTDLVREGEPGDALFIILDGEAVVTREGDEVARVGPGSH